MNNLSHQIRRNARWLLRPTRYAVSGTGCAVRGGRFNKKLIAFIILIYVFK
jgi:hypothetical protein